MLAQHLQVAKLVLGVHDGLFPVDDLDAEQLELLDDGAPELELQTAQVGPDEDDGDIRNRMPLDDQPRGSVELHLTVAVTDDPELVVTPRRGGGEELQGSLRGSLHGLGPGETEHVEQHGGAFLPGRRFISSNRRANKPRSRLRVPSELIK